MNMSNSHCDSTKFKTGSIKAMTFSPTAWPICLNQSIISQMPPEASTNVQQTGTDIVIEIQNLRQRDPEQIGSPENVEYCVVVNAKNKCLERQ